MVIGGRANEMQRCAEITTSDAAAAGRLADLLIDQFGASQIFMDVDTIDYRQDYVQRIDRAVAGCDVLLALIGAKWLDAVDNRGQRRIDDPDDFGPGRTPGLRAQAVPRPAAGSC